MIFEGEDYKIVDCCVNCIEASQFVDLKCYCERHKASVSIIGHCDKWEAEI